MSANGVGLRDWLLQRVSAVYLGIYFVSIAVFILMQSEMSFQVWQQLFTNISVRIATVIALLMIAVHAWIGLTIVATDYIKATCIRLGFLALVFFGLLTYTVWGIAILWG